MARANRALLGRRRVARGGGPERLCPVCGQRRPVDDFRLKRRRRELNLFCNGCRLSDKEGVRRFLRAGRTLAPPPARRKELLLLLREVACRRILKGRRVQMSADEYAVKAVKLADRIAAVVGKTYAEMGDAAQLADDEAIMRIRDYLLELDETVIERNKNKRLARR